MSPVLSLVVPVRNDANRLRRCLETLQTATANVPTEIIVADNGSTDDSAAVGARAGARVVALPDRRVAEVRNQAAATAQGQLLAFIDADHEIDRGWGEAAMKALEDSSIAAVGAQYHAPANGTWVQQAYDLLRRHQPGNRPVEWLPSGNLVVRKDAFERTGGFDATLETCEDVDLCQKLTGNGGRIMAVEGMRSVHLGDPATLKALYFGELWRGRDNVRVSLRVPLTVKSAVGVAIPIVTLITILLLPIGLVLAPLWPLAGLGLAGVCVVWLLTLSRAHATKVFSHAKSFGGTTVSLGRLWRVVLVYHVARALSLVSRSGHSVRRKS